MPGVAQTTRLHIEEIRRSDNLYNKETYDIEIDGKETRDDSALR
jgi:hypothetical protein